MPPSRRRPDAGPGARVKREAAAVLPDILRPDLRVVFCGSAVGAVSARIGAYYAGPGNKFWPILHRIGLTPMQLAPSAYPDVLRYGIGLTDMTKIESGSDASLSGEADDPAAVHAKVLAHRPRALAFNGKRAANVFFRHHFECSVERYGRQPETVGPSAVYVLPSTSGLAVRFWDERPWFALARFLATGD